jgi:cytochrome c peroxidase
VKRALLLMAIAACGGGKHHDPDKTDDGSGSGKPAPGDGGTSFVGMHVTLKPAPPLPQIPAGLPPLPSEDPDVTPERVAFGELLFYEPRLSASGKTSCATCHVPELGYGGAKGVAHQNTDDDKPNLRRAPPLVNLAWKTAFAWDGRYAALTEQLAPHIKGQLGSDLKAAVKALGENGIYQAHIARAGIESEADVVKAIAAFVLTRYQGDAPWDRVERTPDAAPADLKAGYQLFATRAGCATCHVPPLYTDNGFHAIGLVALPDEGRGKVDSAAKGAFATPTLRGAALRGGFFHDGSAKTLDEAIDWHLAGGTGQGADPSIVDKGLAKVTLTAAERAQLGKFVEALTAQAPPPAAPKLPQ